MKKNIVPLKKVSASASVVPEKSVPGQISLIVSTYNAPHYLKLVLRSLAKQSCNKFEVVIADDGSDRRTADIIENFSKTQVYPLKHAWHEDRGFRASAARNRAVSLASGDYLVFLDGDCLVPAEFVERQYLCALAGFMVRGSRVMLRRGFTEALLRGEDVPKSYRQWLFRFFLRDVNRIGPLLPIPYMKHKNRYRWYGVKTCNLAVWRSDFEAVNGFDERYIGWGHEDADLAVRMIRNGTQRREGRSDVPVIHLWHEENNRLQLLANEQRLKAVIEGNNILAPVGLDRHITVT